MGDAGEWVHVIDAAEISQTVQVAVRTKIDVAEPLMGTEAGDDDRSQDVAGIIAVERYEPIGGSRGVDDSPGARGRAHDGDVANNRRGRVGSADGPDQRGGPGRQVDGVEPRNGNGARRSKVQAGEGDTVGRDIEADG